MNIDVASFHFLSDRRLKNFSDREKPMTKISSRIKRFLASEDGPTAVEYAVMLALIVVAIVAIVGALGTSISGTFSSVSSTVGGATGS